jgi:Flp pilus assembly protein TadD
MGNILRSMASMERELQLRCSVAPHRRLEAAQAQYLKAQSNLATAFYELSRYSEACDAFAKAVELSPEDADLRTNLALALQKAGRDAEAKQAFADAKRLRPAN